MRWLKPKSLTPFAFLTLTLAVTWTAAAQQRGTCSSLVERALQAVGNSCSSLDNNSACYGYNQVDSTFYSEVDPGYFSSVSDQTELTQLQTIQTAPFDIGNDQWGIAVMNVQANVPNSLPGAAVTFLLIGDSTIENEVDPEAAFVPGEPVSILTADETIARSLPQVNANVVDTLTSGTELLADALDESGEWVRVLAADRDAWVEIAHLDGADALSDLPVFTATSQSPMQSFYFSTGLGAPTCSEAPDVVTVRSPENLRVNLTVNGAEIGIGSTISFKTDSEGRAVIVVQEGSMILPDGRVVETGETVEVILNEDGEIESFEEIRPATEEELNLGRVSELFFNVLFGGTDVEFVEPTPEPTDEPANPPPPAPVVDCRSFHATSPLNGLNYGENTFYWDAAPGATQYRVTVYNDGESSKGEFTQQFSVDAPQTNVTGILDQNTISGGFQFSWIVEALVNGRVACRSDRVFTQRETAPPITVLSASWYCSGYAEVTVQWSGANAGDQIYITWTEYGYPYSPPPQTGSSGSYTDSVEGGDILTNASVSTSSGLYAALPDISDGCSGAG
jgi:hypothetical protein